MGLRPIDLQTMFMRMGELSKEQALAQDSAAQKLALQDARMAKQAKENDERITELSEIPEGPDKVSGDPEDSGNEDQSPDNPKQKQEAQTVNTVVEDKGDEPLRESYLGTHIDIQG